MITIYVAVAMSASVSLALSAAKGESPLKIK